MSEIIRFSPQEPLEGGWILYAENDSTCSSHYIDLYRRACRKYGTSIRFGTYQPRQCWDAKSRQRLAEIVQREKPLFVINRTRDYRLAEEMEKIGVGVYNHSLTAQLGNDKAKACRFMEACGIPVMPTMYGVKEAPRWYPAVAKSCSGHGGTEVFWIPDEKGWEHWKQHVCRGDTRYIVQKASSDPGKDLRVYVAGNQIAAAVLRSSSRDFRSNYCLGGSAALYELSVKQRKLVERITDRLSIGMAGVDFIFHHGELVFNELEDVAGARSLYSLSDYDIVDTYMKFLCGNLPHSVSVAAEQVPPALSSPSPQAIYSGQIP